MRFSLLGRVFVLRTIQTMRSKSRVPKAVSARMTIVQDLAQRQLERTSQFLRRTEETHSPHSLVETVTSRRSGPCLTR